MILQKRDDILFPSTMLALSSLSVDGSDSSKLRIEKWQDIYNSKASLSAEPPINARVCKLRIKDRFFNYSIINVDDGYSQRDVKIIISDMNAQEWIHGPSVLYQSSDQWPSSEPIEETVEETRRVMLFHAVVEAETVSSWTKLVRVTATVLRFISNCQRKRAGLPIVTCQSTNRQRRLIKAEYSTDKKPLQQEELQKAEIILWRQAQYESFPDEMNTLTKNLERSPGQRLEKIEKSSSLYKRSPVLDEEGVLRVRGRLENNEELPFDKRYPIILSGKHDITKKLILHFHNKFGHANRETVFNELRQKFWIPKARAAIRHVTKECVWCKVNLYVPSVPMMAPLPVQRTTPHLRPFSAVGVDYLGPGEVTVGRRKEKRWIVVFTCMAVRAVHLDVVHSLSIQSCLMAIRRFACKRGVPEQIFSDNATCFRGANTAMMETMQGINIECAEKVTSAVTAWHFNPPSTPHMGGVWERMVRSVKEALRAYEDGRKLTDEILSTSLAEAEDMINTRPLTYVPQEVADEEVITPNHFLRGRTMSTDMLLKDSVDFAETLRNVYKRRQRNDVIELSINYLGYRLIPYSTILGSEPEESMSYFSPYIKSVVDSKLKRMERKTGNC
ncbi:uncharacterized protein LOC135711830 [Ochlerotatus camptorhynchus]|uniref:uncharacterized protein LOC135711830 n=1 Tax=Ochlerotatus camptorhynchus TaxID=644619 RepID=UPI0031DFA30A